MRDVTSNHRDRPGGREIDCSVLVPVLNEEAEIVASIRAMLAQEFSGRLEFLVVDGGSRDRTREIVAALALEDPRIRLLDNSGRIASSGLNVALTHARGRWVARMDAHTEYPNRYIALGVERLMRGDTSWVSGPPIPVGRGAVSRAVALALATPLGRGGSRKWAAERSPGEEYELDAGVFAGVWEREVVLGYGGWDERWVRNQDSEMAGRFLARGERLICLPAMASDYRPRDSLGALWRQYFEYGVFREKTAVAHPHTMRRSHLVAPALVATLPAAVLAPRPLRTVARAGLCAYVAVLGHAGVAASRESGSAQDAGLVPAALAAMHTAHGAGTWVGAGRHGLPLAGIARALGARRLADRLTPAPAPVYAPSLGARADADVITLPDRDARADLSRHRRTG